MHISRKTLMAVGGVLLVLLTFLKVQFGLSAGFLADLHLGKRGMWRRYGTNKAWESEPE